MTTTIIISLCVLLLMAYLFDLSASKTKVPSVILLLLSGWMVKQILNSVDITMPNFAPLLPILGTVGLIMIVLEGALELELNKSKFNLVKKSVLVAFIPMIGLSFFLAFLFYYFQGVSFKDAFINAVPFCVISSAIAIPSVSSLDKYKKEFVIYESSMSDILGVVLFNFVAFNAVINFSAVSTFFIQIIIVLIGSFVCTIFLAFLLNRIEHHVKFVPIIILIILIYSVSKIYHLPGLIFIMLFGLFIGNLDELRRFAWIDKFKPDELNKEVHKFKENIAEFAFIIRALFFLLFGFLINTADILNTQSLGWAFIIVFSIVVFRAVSLKLFNVPLKPLLFIAPRGLITILLFLSILPENSISLVDNALVIQVIILSALVMMIGLMTSRTK
ncbi:cation:proton antiporter [Sediminibacterium salmoneum]|uniref:cation:proton antiporter n=1 Tax=Sediminibacterium salmoneum TaxID=426421 RepID=UPI00047B9126|nr:cation:proton antiporter [Sediminibacterium salmoneum]